MENLMACRKNSCCAIGIPVAKTAEKTIIATAATATALVNSTLCITAKINFLVHYIWLLLALLFSVIATFAAIAFYLLYVWFMHRAFHAVIYYIHIYETLRGEARYIYEASCASFSFSSQSVVYQCRTAIKLPQTSAAPFYGIGLPWSKNFSVPIIDFSVPIIGWMEGGGVGRWYNFYSSLLLQPIIFDFILSSMIRLCFHVDGALLSLTPIAPWIKRH